MQGDFSAAAAKANHGADHAQPSLQPWIDDARDGVAYLSERGTLRAGRPYIAGARVAKNIAFISGRHSGARGETFQRVFSREDLRNADAEEAQAAAVASVLLALPEVESALFVPAVSLAAFAVAGRPLPVVYGSGLVRRTPHPLAVVPWSERLEPASILRTIESHPGNSAVLLAHRGVLAYAAEPLSKLARFLVSLEEAAELALHAQALGGARPLPASAYEQMRNGIAGD